MPGVDIATLKMRVDATDLERGKHALDDLTNAGARTERRFISLAEYDARRARQSEVLNKALRERAQTEREVAQMMNGTAAATENVANKSRLAGAPIARLNNSMVVLARQAAGAHPVVGQLADAIGTFAIGTARMVPVLAGLAAVATAIRLIGRESREAKERTEEFNRVLAEAAGAAQAQAAREAGVLVGGDRAAVGFAQSEALRLRGERDRLVAERDALRGLGPNIVAVGELDRRITAVTNELFVREQQIAVFEKQLNDERERGVAIINRQIDALNERARAEREAIAPSLRTAEIDVGRVARGEVTFFDSPTRQLARMREQAELEERAIIRRQRLGDVQTTYARKLALVTRREKELEDAAEERQRAQEAANDALIRSLENVGRAYGGVIDQTLALTAAVLSLSRMPGFDGVDGTGKGGARTTGDLARGYGTAALTGLGFGASTGDPFLGGIGGGVAGYALLGGPYGPIVGAVAGIVGGLIDSGHRAREAQRIWRNALRDFDAMFDDLSPIEQNILSLDRAFEQLSGGRTRDEVERALVELRNLAAQVYVAGIDEQIKQYERLLKIYDENAKQAKKLADSERDLYDARFRTLNAPTGFNAAYFGYQAGALFEPSQNNEVTVEVPVVIEIDGEVISETVIKKQSRLSKRGSDPYFFSER